MKGSTFLMPFLAALAVLFGIEARSEEVPESLPHFKAIQLYQSYLKRPSPSAFAISVSGAFSASWQQENIDLARKQALAECEKMEFGTPCNLVSENGVAIVPTIDIKNLKGKFRDAQGRIWPPIEVGMVPEKIASDPDFIAAYLEYANKRGMKAFAISNQGKWGDASGHVTEIQARQVAMSHCQSQLQGNGECEVIDVNNSSMGPMVKLNE